MLNKRKEKHNNNTHATYTRRHTRASAVTACLSLNAAACGMAPATAPRDAGAAPDARCAQSLFARVAAAPGTGRPCGKGECGCGCVGKRERPVGVGREGGERRCQPANACRLDLLFLLTRPLPPETRPVAIPFGGAPAPPAPGAGGGGGCPVVGGPPQSAGGCPVVGGDASAAADSPTNHMPATPHNTPAPGQRTPLAMQRVASSIPTAGEGDLPQHQGCGGDTNTNRTWLYPSPQMFFNSMRRKGWTPDEADMPAVVAIHNAVNERAWADVVAWEAHAGERKCGGPRLVRFEGRPRDISPKARFLNMLGYRLPFDRHDWYVDRCGAQVRYVIDFYNAAPTPVGPQTPGSPPPPVALHLDVRPALDTPGAVWERIKAQAAWVASGRWRE